MSLGDLQKKQGEYDEKFWEVNSPEFEKVRHITLHLTKLLGKLGSYCESAEHGGLPSKTVITEEITPDLLFYALQLSNLFGESLEEQYTKRITGNIKKFSNPNP